MASIDDLKNAKKKTSFRWGAGLERFDLVTPLIQRGVPVKVPNMDDPVQR